MKRYYIISKLTIIKYNHIITIEFATAHTRFEQALILIFQVNLTVSMEQQEVKEARDVHAEMIQACVSAFDELGNEKSEAMNTAQQLDLAVAGKNVIFNMTDWF